MRECLDEAILQSFFDGELESEQMAKASSHLALCATCAAAARELENENSLLATALAPEFDTPVPTEHLRNRIDAAIAGLSMANSGAATSSRNWFQSLASLFTFSPQRAFAYAGLVMVLLFAAVFGMIQWRQAPTSMVSSEANPAKSNTPDAPPSQPTPSNDAVVLAPVGTDERPTRPISTRRNPTPKQQPASANQTAAQVKLLPGERSYLQTIASLDSTIRSRGNRPMRPALQAEYERNLAVVNRALAATRSAAKKNPNDPDAVEFMFAAYQSKLDLLNTVADARVYNRQQ